MECSYVRELDKNYLVINSDLEPAERYKVRMLQQNQISGLLHVHAESIDEQVQLFYEVTAKLPMDRVYERSPISGSEIKRLLRAISKCMEEMKEYLLNGTDLVLDPAYIFVNAQRSQMSFCLVPGYGKGRELFFMQLADFVLKHLDPNDQTAVQIGHAFFDCAGSGPVNISELLEDTERPNELDADIKDNRKNGRSNIRKEIRNDIRNNDNYELEEEVFSSSEDDNRLIFAETSDNGHEGKKTAKKRFRKERVKVQKRKRSDSKKRDYLYWGIGAGLLLVCTLVYGAAVTALELDLTQAGALAASMIALFWLVGSLAAQHREKEHGIWDDVLPKEEENEEAAFLAALMSEEGISEQVYGGRYIQEQDNYLVREEKRLRNSGLSSVQRGLIERPEEDIRGKRNNTEVFQSGETRILGDTENLPKVMLISHDIGRCHDIRIENRSVLIGQKSELVDVCIPLDVMSRIHAKLEIGEDCCYLEDQNSSNGTFVGDTRLAPFERRKITESGTDIAFANVQFKLMFR